MVPPQHDAIRSLYVWVVWHLLRCLLNQESGAQTFNICCLSFPLGQKLDLLLKSLNTIHMSLPFKAHTQCVLGWGPIWKVGEANLFWIGVMLAPWWNLSHWWCCTKIIQFFINVECGHSGVHRSASLDPFAHRFNMSWCHMWKVLSQRAQWPCFGWAV